MATKLISHLIEKSQEHEQLKLLVMQIESFYIRRQHPSAISLKKETDEDKKIVENSTKTFFSGPHGDEVGLEFLARALQKDGFHLQITDQNDLFMELRFAKAEAETTPYSDQALQVILSKLIQNIPNSVRALMPIEPAYQKLKLKSDTILRFAKLLFGAEYLSCTRMMMPFCFYMGSDKKKRVTEDNLNDLCHWTVKHAEDNTLTFEEAYSLYTRFIKWIDEIIMKGNKEWEKVRGKVKGTNILEKVTVVEPS